MSTHVNERASAIQLAIVSKYRNPRRTAGERLEGREKLLRALDSYVDADKRVNDLLVQITPSLRAIPDLPSNEDQAGMPVKIPPRSVGDSHYPEVA